MRDEMAEKVQELEEELTMALSELKKAKDANKMLNEVSKMACCLFVFVFVVFCLFVCFFGGGGGD